MLEIVGFIKLQIKIIQITRDHSYVNVLLETGEISEEQAKTHPKKNVILKAIGSEQTITPDFYECRIYAEFLFTPLF